MSRVDVDVSAVSSPRLRHVELDPSAVSAWAHALGAVPNPNADPCGALAAARHASTLVPLAARLALDDLACSPDGPSALLISGAPTDRVLPASPVDGRCPPGRSSFVAEGVVLSLASGLGSPATFEAERGFDLVHHVVPRPGCESEASSSGSQVLSDHTEVASEAATPSYLVLGCARPDPAGTAVTRVVDVRGLVARLDDASRRVLQEPRFSFRVPESFVGGLGGAHWTDDVPVLESAADDDYLMRFDGPSALHGTDAEAEAALALVREMLAGPSAATEVRLQPGQVLVVDNRRALHGRGAFEPAYSTGASRWLVRAYVFTDLARWRAYLMPGMPVLASSIHAQTRRRQPQLI